MTFSVSGLWMMGHSRKAVLSVGVYWLAKILMTYALLRAFMIHESLGGPIAFLALAASLWISGSICRGILPSASSQHTAVRWITSAVLSLAGFLLLVGTGDWHMLLSLVAVTTFVAAGLDLLVSLAGGHSRTGAVVLGGFALFVTAPLWLGPIAVGDSTLLAAVIWSNPFVHLALQGGLDLFRTDLLYGLSPIGDVRYSYPDAKIALLLPLGVVLILIAGLMYRAKAS